MAYELIREQFVAADPEKIFAFFSDVARLGEITPEYVGLEDLTTDESPMHEGMTIVHRIRWFGIPLRWSTTIEEFDPPARFVDRQISGPYGAWRHEHIFEERDNGTLVIDRVVYAMPLGIVGRVAHALLISRELRNIFEYRARRISEIFSAPGVTVAQ